MKLHFCLPTYQGLLQLATYLQLSSEDYGTQTLTTETPVNNYCYRYRYRYRYRYCYRYRYRYRYICRCCCCCCCCCCCYRYYYKHSRLVLGNACKGTHTSKVNKHNKRGTWTIMLAHHVECVMLYRRQRNMYANHL